MRALVIIQVMHSVSRTSVLVCLAVLRGCGVAGEFTLNKSECSRQALRLNGRAWNNGRGSRSDFVGFAAEIMINRGGRGHSYFCVRGEIFGPQEDALQRRQLPSTSPLIKNESQRIEGD